MPVTTMRRVTKIEANPLLMNQKNTPQLKRVAAYCRVSTDDDEQLNSYEAQIAYYTEAIAKNPSWSFVGIYADEGITGTATSKRKDFLRLMRDCEKGKVDMILTKSISRFARNTVDSLTWVRKLRTMGISVYFEEQAIDSLKAENEMLIGLFSVIAQSESENISSNVRWGIRQSMKSGKFASNFSCYGYKRGDDGVPVIVPEQAEIVRKIFDLFLDGYSVDQVQTYLFERNIKTYTGKDLWRKDVIRGVLTNEKYAGDLLLQKTFVVDCISKKTKKNNGELAKFLVSNNHPAIVDRDTFNKAQAEMARRSSKHKKSSVARTEQGKYSGKYALSELLVCGECGSSYRRTSKLKNNKRKYVWRCINRIENGQDSCDAIGVDEQKLHNAICRCLSKMFDSKNAALNLMKSNLTYAVSGNESALNAFAIESQIESLNGDMDRCCEMRLATSGDIGRFDEEIKKISDQLVELRKQLDLSRVQMSADEELSYEVNRISDLFANTDTSFSEYDDVTVRRLVECIRVMKDRRIIVILKGGVQAEESF